MPDRVFVCYTNTKTEKQKQNKIVLGTVVKAKIRELEEEVRIGSSRRMRKELTGVVQAISGKRRVLVRFHDG